MWSRSEADNISSHLATSRHVSSLNADDVALLTCHPGDRFPRLFVYHHISSYTVTCRHVLCLKPTMLCCRLVSPEITFSGSSCLVFSFHIRGSETGYLTVYVAHGADTTVVFREGLYSHDTWQTARVMVHTNYTFQVDIRGHPPTGRTRNYKL